MCSTKRPRGVAREGVITSGLERVQDVRREFSRAGRAEVRIIASLHHLTMTRAVYKQHSNGMASIPYCDFESHSLRQEEY
jgi:hypothetical protein